VAHHHCLVTGRKKERGKTKGKGKDSYPSIPRVLRASCLRSHHNKPDHISLSSQQLKITQTNLPADSKHGALLLYHDPACHKSHRSLPSSLLPRWTAKETPSSPSTTTTGPLPIAHISRVHPRAWCERPVFVEDRRLPCLRLHPKLHDSLS
jgi:hypothetical protein